MTEARLNPTLRELLDAVRPDSDDLVDADLRKAASAVETSPDWQALFDNQQQCDKTIAAAMQDIEFSAAARQRLLDTLAADREETPSDPPQPSDEAAPLTRRMSRRWAATAAASVGLTACLGLGLLLFNSGAAALTLDEIRGHMPLSKNGQINEKLLSPFDGSFDLTLPTGRWERVIFDHPLGMNWSGDDHHDAALLPFVTQGRRPVHGYLLIVPATGVADVPPEQILSTVGVSYFPIDNTAWTSPNSETVYVCFVDPGELPSLKRLLYPQSA